MRWDGMDAMRGREAETREISEWMWVVGGRDEGVEGVRGKKVGEGIVKCDQEKPDKAAWSNL